MSVINHFYGSGKYLSYLILINKWQRTMHKLYENVTQVEFYEIFICFIVHTKRIKGPCTNYIKMYPGGIFWNFYMCCSFKADQGFMQKLYKNVTQVEFSEFFKCFIVHAKRIKGPCTNYIKLQPMWNFSKFLYVLKFMQSESKV